jgi:2-amino-4-hydroxy-6-hydroxymethyldihydropteridine diphosphokinase
MHKVYLLLGGNLGDRIGTLKQASEHISHKVGEIISSSKLYETAAWGKTDQPNFLNQVVEVRTPLTPEQVLQTINVIEVDLGRVRLEHWGERIIDIDILFYDDLVLQTQRLTIPHPQLHLRKFTLLPLVEIAPNFVHPVTGKSITNLLQICPDSLEVKVW